MTIGGLFDTPGNFGLNAEGNYSYRVTPDSLFLRIDKEIDCAELLGRPGSDCSIVFENSFFLKRETVSAEGYRLELVFVRAK